MHDEIVGFPKFNNECFIPFTRKTPGNLDFFAVKATKNRKRETLCSEILTIVPISNIEY